MLSQFELFLSETQQTSLKWRTLDRVVKQTGFSLFVARSNSKPIYEDGQHLSRR